MKKNKEGCWDFFFFFLEIDHFCDLISPQAFASVQLRGRKTEVGAERNKTLQVSSTTENFL